MSPKQYAFFLDELDSKLPLLKTHFEMLCATPGWRNESSAERSVSGQAFALCRKLSSEMSTLLAQSIVEVRIRPKTSVEFKMQYALNELIDAATGNAGLRPYYDLRNEDNQFIVKALGPLFLTLYGHVYATTPLRLKIKTCGVRVLTQTE